MDNISLVCLVEDFTTLASSPSALCATKQLLFLFRPEKVILKIHHYMWFAFWNSFNNELIELIVFENSNESNQMGFWGTRVMEIVKKHDSGGLVWKRIKLTTTRKANAKKRLLRVWQNEAVLKACVAQVPSATTTTATTAATTSTSTST